LFYGGVCEDNAPFGIEHHDWMGEFSKEGISRRTKAYGAVEDATVVGCGTHTGCVTLAADMTSAGSAGDVPQTISLILAHGHGGFQLGNFGLEERRTPVSSATSLRRRKLNALAC
jgi:hypothetical protein